MKIALSILSTRFQQMSVIDKGDSLNKTTRIMNTSGDPRPSGRLVLQMN